MTPLHLLLLIAALGLLSPAQSAPTVSVVLSNAYRSPPILPNFVSFSLETYFVRCWMGPDGPRPSWVNLIRQLQLTPSSTHPITFRVGGNSGDTSFYNPNLDLPVPSLPGPAWQFNITDADLHTMQASMQATRSQLIIGLNMRQASNYSLATSYVAALQRHVGLDLVFAFEVGNEVDFYSNNGIRPRNYSVAEFVAEVNRYAAAIADTVGQRVPIQAGAVATDQWALQIASIVANTTGPLTSASLHHYPTTWCGHNLVTPLQLISDDYAEREANFIARNGLVDAVQALGVPLVIGEGNTASCYGAPNVSNSYASALWTVDTLFHQAQAGVVGWSFTVGGLYHSDSPYHIPVNDSAFLFSDCTTPNDSAVVEPMFYGMLLFNRATANYSALVSAGVTTTDPLIKVWPVRSSVTGAISVVILHKNPNATEPATISLDLGVNAPYYGATASLVRLHSKGGLTAEFGIELAGQTFDGSKDGLPVGEERREAVKGSRGVFEFSVAPLDAALLVMERLTTAGGQVVADE